MALSESENRTCGRCRKQKPLTAFKLDRRTKSGIGAICKVCASEDACRWQKENPSKSKLVKRGHYLRHQEKIKERSRDWYRANTEYAGVRQAAWRRKNKGRVNALAKVRRNATPAAILNERVRTAIRISLRGRKFGRHWEGLVGYTLKDLMRHLESLFVEGMSWGNFGKWHLDHVVPKSWFKFEGANDAEFKECWSLKNLQPKWSRSNLSKGARYVG